MLALFWFSKIKSAVTGGNDLKESFEQCAMAMFGYMTEIETVAMERSESIEAQGFSAGIFEMFFYLSMRFFRFR